MLIIFGNIDSVGSYYRFDGGTVDDSKNIAEMLIDYVNVKFKNRINIEKSELILRLLKAQGVMRQVNIHIFIGVIRLFLNTLMIVHLIMQKI